MSFQPVKSSEYGSRKPDPVRLANVTVQAVDSIGMSAAGEIDKTAEEVIQGAAEVAHKLRELGLAIREHSQIASEQVSSFCEKATTVIEGVRELQDRLLDGGTAATKEAGDEAILPLPVIVAK